MDKAISPLDGRYGKRLQHLGAYFSEFALMRMRVIVELRYLQALNETGLFEKLSKTELKRMEDTEHNFAENDYQRIKEIESRINHDVKSCEIYLQEQLQLQHPNMIHFGLTSEDVNNLAYTFLFRDYIEQQQLPQLRQLIRTLTQRAKEWQDTPFPARTHGQMASPSTGGKEMAVYLSRLLRQYRKLEAFRFSAKLNGATGNYSALHSVFPGHDWLNFSEQFMHNYGLQANLVTTQIEDHDTWAEYFAITRQINNIILDLDRDVWLYLTLGYLVISADECAVGSSTMPHKVNPINFENSEGNLQVSTALLNGLNDKLGNSRLQRDLSDSTATRNIGVALAYSYLALQETENGLQKLSINAGRCREELQNHPELLAEPIQTVLRREGVTDPYNLLKDITRGKRVSRDDLNTLIDNLHLGDAVREQLKKMQTETYTGLAAQICSHVIKEAGKTLGE